MIKKTLPIPGKAIFFSCLIFFCNAVAYGADDDEPPAVGNFILPDSQQPGSFISFGQTILDKNETQLYLFSTDFIGPDQHALSVTPWMVYGLTDNFSLALNLPIAASFQNGANQISGLQDGMVQLEYAFYERDTHDFTEQATIVTDATIPTGSSKTDPATGFGSPSFFIGATYNRTYADWILFTSHGAVLTTSANNLKYGDLFFYQAGLGRNIMNIDSKWIFAWIVEADGQYTEKNIINGAADADSGGNVVYVTPSLWISSRNFIIQPGVGFPVIQHLFGNQEKNSYMLALNLSWSFWE